MREGESSDVGRKSQKLSDTDAWKIYWSAVTKYLHQPPFDLCCVHWPHWVDKSVSRWPLVYFECLDVCLHSFVQHSDFNQYPREVKPINFHQRVLQSSPSVYFTMLTWIFALWGFLDRSSFPAAFVPSASLAVGSSRWPSGVDINHVVQQLSSCHTSLQPDRSRDLKIASAPVKKIPSKIKPCSIIHKPHFQRKAVE